MASSWMENPTDKDRLLLNTNGDHRFRCEDNNVAFTHVQPHYYRVRSVEPCHHLGWFSQALILSILALGAMPKQQQQQQHRQPLPGLRGPPLKKNLKPYQGRKLSCACCDVLEHVAGDCSSVTLIRNGITAWVWFFSWNPTNYQVKQFLRLDRSVPHINPTRKIDITVRMYVFTTFLGLKTRIWFGMSNEP